MYNEYINGTDNEVINGIMYNAAIDGRKLETVPMGLVVQLGSVVDFNPEMLETVFENEYGKQITAVFHNASKSSVSLKKCAIVKFRVEGNSLVSIYPEHGQFWVNGVNNNSAITDIIECLGTPSHFSSITPNNYMIDYFISPKDRRSGITLWIDIESDCITTIEFSYY